MPTKYKKRNSAYIHQPHSGKKAAPPEADAELNAVTALATYHNDDVAREYLEKIRWPNGPVCPHCGSKEVTKLAGKATRPGVHKCKAKGCRKQFTVTVKTIFEASHISLRNWVVAFQLMCASKKGISAHQLHRLLDITYKSAWFMCHRIRHAMDNGIGAPYTGVVEQDEAWIGGKPRPKHGHPRQARKSSETDKQPVAVLVERGGRAYCRPIDSATVAELKDIATKATPDSILMTDGAQQYLVYAKEFSQHHAVNHAAGEYVRKVNDELFAHNNTAESYFALLKRGHHGTFHHFSKKHMFRYCNEFSFRWSHRKATDGQRTRAALASAEGKRLKYK